MLSQEKCAQYWPSDGSVSYGDITVELKKEEECESYTVRDLLVTNTRVRAHPWPFFGGNLSFSSSSSCRAELQLCSPPPGKQEPADPAVSLPRLARGWDPQRREGDDQHHRGRAEAAAAVGQPPHHRALQVKPLKFGAGFAFSSKPPAFFRPCGLGLCVEMRKKHDGVW